MCEEIKKKFGELRGWKGKGERAPHKPLLVLWMIGRCLNNEERLISYDAADEALKLLIQKYGTPRDSLHTHYPFWRLKNDGIWKRENDKDVQRTKSGDPIIGDLRHYDVHAGFTDEIYEAFIENECLAIEVANTLLDANFPPTLHNEILEVVGIVANYEYVRRRPRSPTFTNDVLNAWGYRCAVCNLSVRMDEGKHAIGLEAAHIKWHCFSGPDEISNGISLCAIHHKLFDKGAFTLKKDTSLQELNRSLTTVAITN